MVAEGFRPPSDKLYCSPPKSLPRSPHRSQASAVCLNPEALSTCVLLLVAEDVPDCSAFRRRRDLGLIAKLVQDVSEVRAGLGMELSWSS